MNTDNVPQQPQDEAIVPIDEIVVNGALPEGVVLPTLEDGRLVMEDGTQFELTEGGGRWLDADGQEIEPGMPFKTNDGVYEPSISQADLARIDQHLKSQGDEGIFQDEE